MCFHRPVWSRYNGWYPCRSKKFLSSPECTPTVLSPNVNRPGREADQSPLSSADMRKEWSYTSTPSSADLRKEWSYISTPYSAHLRKEWSYTSTPSSADLRKEWSYISTPYSADLRKEWSYISTPPMSCTGIIYICVISIPPSPFPSLIPAVKTPLKILTTR